jgi:flagellar export protein FliJ
MSREERVATVLRVRRAQEAEAAGGLARAGAAAREAERVLGALMAHYDRHRELDRRDDAVPERLRDREVRMLHAQAIQRGRARVREALATVDQQRSMLQVRSQAVRAMERLEARIREEEDAERLRRERRDLDEVATARWSAPDEEGGR